MPKNSQSKDFDSLVKIPPISAQTVTLTFAILFCFQENSQLFIQLIQEMLALQNSEDFSKGLEESLNRQILPAAQLTCLLPLAEKMFLENRTSENAVALIYILFRLLYKHMGNPEPNRKESIELWERIWEFVPQFPIVKNEWAEMEERNDLKGWKKDLQEYSRNKWKYFSNEHLPRFDERVKYVCENLRSFLNIASAEK
jgi:hypothetical protein